MCRDDRVFTDVMLAIKSEFVDLMQERKKNHEFRPYKLRPTVHRMWLYESSPRCAVRCVRDAPIVGPTTVIDPRLLMA